MSLFEVSGPAGVSDREHDRHFANPFLDAMGRFILNAHIAGDDYVAYGDAHR